MDSKLARGMRRDIWFYLLVSPAALFTFVFGYLTLPYIVIAFQRFNYQTGIFDSEWIGLRNFLFFFKSNRAWLVTSNTLKLNFLFITTTTLLSIFISLLLNEARSQRFAKLLQSTYLFPNFISWVAVSYIVFSLLSTNDGIVNRFLLYAGLPKVNWYQSASVWPGVLTTVVLWKNVGMTSVIYLATISGIDQNLYEAARIDGASRYRQNLHITIPLLMPTVAILSLLAIGRIFYADFAMIYALVGDNGLLYKTTDVIDTYVFRMLRINGDPANAMAAGLYQSVFGFVLVLSSNLVVRKFFREGALY